MKTVYESLKDKGDENDLRVIHLASAKANYLLTNLKENTLEVSSFSAGDVSICEKSSAKETAKNLFLFALKECRSLIFDDSFAFLGV